ncbi:hypothetical protein BDZ97DRAFT_984668 [Flammula alnicola]|nr:hypothetical protein BDZ97DRAFT_984668 [Flammula alnicola]
MSNGSPTAYLLWAILSCIFLAFLFVHLWAYDRFNCLKWDSGRQPGAFKRVMTYSYLATLPLLVLFSVATTSLKFKEGYVVLPDGTIMPRPLSAWAPEDKEWLLPLYFVLSTGWSLELVTHLEELAFWLFLLHQGPGKREWFHSWEFRTWYLGSMVAVLGMPLVTLVTRREIERVQAWIFLAGASAGTSTTVAFLYVLARFPGFILYVKDGGAEPDVVVRLATFYNLNRIRVMFRFLFTVPLLMIAIDALRGPYPIVGNPFALDFLLMIGGIGCFISSGITLLIFFPRSITHESGYKAKVISAHQSAKAPTATSPLANYYAHEQGPSSPKPYDSGPASPVSPARMGGFRYSTEQPMAAAGQPVYATESQPARPRRPSGESETSPGYESDAESIGMATSPTLPFHMMMTNPPTAASRPTSGGRSDDTVWEHHDDFPVHAHGQVELLQSGSSKFAARRRPHSDGPFVYNRHGIIVAAIPGAGGGASAAHSEEGHHGGHMHRSSDPHRENAPSHLHPYLINFTSPIDLLDETPSHQLPEEFRSPHLV